MNARLTAVLALILFGLAVPAADGQMLLVHGYGDAEAGKDRARLGRR